MFRPGMMAPPLRHRVTPGNAIELARGPCGLVGNRGILHDETGRLGAAAWRHRRWIACVTRFGARRLTLAAPGHYTVLFFMDEAVALAAGHRPCAECRRADYRRFQQAWRLAHGLAEGSGPRAEAMDAVLHAARTGPRPQAALACLPAGVFVRRAGRPAPFLLWDGSLRPWHHAGYGASEPADAAERVTVLTPGPAVAVLRAGYGLGGDLLQRLTAPAISLRAGA